jgi:uncharacterized protein YecE (DUF72 family)
LAGVLRVGMSGFSYPEWIGDFYPPKTRREAMLAYYSTRFPAVEINMTFRRDVQQPTIERWRDAVGEDFRFTFKANARITHFRRLVDVGDVVAAFLDTLKPMGTRLGAVLFQTHPNLKFDASVLESFCASLPSGPAYAFEPRHESFQASEVDNVLRRHGVARCLNDDLFDPKAYRVTGPIAYFRFHRDTYSPRDIAERASIVGAIADEGTDVYVFYAHEDNPDSVKPALQTQKLLRA